MFSKFASHSRAADFAATPKALTPELGPARAASSAARLLGALLDSSSFFFDFLLR